MPPQVEVSLAAKDALSAAGIGFFCALARAAVPVRPRGKAAFFADLFAAAFCVVLLQGFSACQAAAGQLRGYHLAAACAGALFSAAPGRWVYAAARGLFRALALPVRLCGLAVAACAKTVKRQLAARKAKKTVRKAAKNPKKQLQNPPRLLYNSNVSAQMPAQSASAK